MLPLLLRHGSFVALSASGGKAAAELLRLRLLLLVDDLVVKELALLLIALVEQLVVFVLLR